MKNFRIFFFAFILFELSCKPGKMGKVKYGTDGKVVSGESKTKCSPPTKRYTKDLDIKVKASIDSLTTVPFKNLEAGITQKVVRLSDYTSEGLDLDLFLFRICEMANNRGFTSEQTAELITLAMSKWNSSEEIKKKSESLN